MNTPSAGAYWLLLACCGSVAGPLALLGGSLSANQEELNIALAFRPEMWKANWLVLLAMFPLSSALSMYSFPTGSLTWPALALALGAYFRNKA